MHRALKALYPRHRRCPCSRGSAAPDSPIPYTLKAHRVLDDVLLRQLLQQLEHVAGDVRVLVAQQRQQAGQRRRARELRVQLRGARNLFASIGYRL